MKSLLVSTFLSLMFITFTSTSSAKEYAGKTIPDTFNYGGKSMVLNGVGLRKKFFINLYTGSLYLTAKSKDAETIMAEDSPMAIRLSINSSMITPNKMKEATLDGFRKTTQGNTAKIKPQIDQLLKTFDKGVGPGDVYELINMPGSGVHVVRNGSKVATIRSPEFKKALFGIWLSNQPIQGNLKQQMLGM